MEDQRCNLVVGRVQNISKHPNADKLFLAKVDVGDSQLLRVVFGTMAIVNEGDLVPVAIAPTTLPTGIKIENRIIRGEPTECMLCLDSEFILDGQKKLTKFESNTRLGEPVLEVLKAKI